MLTTHRENRSLIVALDVGTSKIVAVVAEINPEETAYEIIGFGQVPSKGLRRGVVVDIELAVQSIQRVLEEAELMANVKIREVITGIAGSHVRSKNSHGMVAIQNKEVTPGDVERVLETARAVNIPNDEQVLHVLTQEFIIDGQEDVREPVGMSGLRMEVRVHIITGSVSATQNIMRCIRRCGLEVSELILQPLASARSVVTSDEKDLGVCLVDIGGGTTDIAVFVKGAIRHTAVIPLGGDQITSDIAMALRTPLAAAEEIKIQQGCALRQLVEGDQKVAVPGVGERGMRQMARQTLVEVIEPRVEEMFSLVLTELRTSRQLDLIPSGVVLTGGSSALEGMLELGEEIFHVPVRLGVPFYRGPLADVVRKPQFATVMGLLAFGFEEHQKARGGRSSLLTLGYSWERIKHWFKSSF
ncbi:cell division protein FtsA [Ferrovum myxofaciens]|jgi:cell division protein FtsA|uniref:Cell division protein FtsA n=2 Tax=root TaxID=1 RepID=A0A8F3E076_9PROT|nr:cell division protein FtsA [Ferrovum myxofaciens]MBW8028969.1 cell division protein FtsA [Ferrovum sp.]KXW58613.1 cell division protein FtsA [Ferrovum myxofaciens]MBU6994661.1 cell division protein FtsA [Ferrovum myxofaciens]QKE38514.1 MAG: cell division protein FtsA [Ferrovum myxofaciens]QKE41049.1 MAG: cell division protein FtsA [Ferrovum myxofaciens]